MITAYQKRRKGAIKAKLAAIAKKAVHKTDSAAKSDPDQRVEDKQG